MAHFARQRVNYDTIAHLYDEPLRDHVADPNLANFIEERANHLPDLRVLDMGCGTGKQVAANRATYPDATIIGSDLFAGMLAQARQRSDVMLVQSDSSRTAFRTDTFDYISNQFAYAHVLDKPRMIAETFRLLKSGGRFVMVNIDPWSMRNWLLYTYFPAAWDRDTVDFLPADTFTDLMRQVGFVNIHVERQLQVINEKLVRFLTYASDRWRTSQLLCIPNAAYEQGIAKLRSDIARMGDRVTTQSESCLVTVSGNKP
jgi:ubiquinone/menaquinone biosynthesis C-methylase UbiE